MLWTVELVSYHLGLQWTRRTVEIANTEKTGRFQQICHGIDHTVVIYTSLTLGS